MLVVFFLFRPFLQNSDHSKDLLICMGPAECAHHSSNMP